MPYKVLFSQARLVEDLLRGFVPERHLEALDFESLEQVPANFVGEDTSGKTHERANDLVWKIRLKKGGQIFVYLMLEFQSTVARWMALRVLTYTSLLLQDLVRHGHLTPEGKLPTVLPFVLYNGTRAWTAPVEVADLFAEVPGMESFLERFRPRLKYFLIDEGRLRESDVDRPGNVTAALFRIERSEDPEEVHEAVAELAGELAGPEHEGTRKSVSIWLRKIVFAKGWEKLQLQYPGKLEDLETMLRDAQQRWWNEAKQEGHLAGVRKGKRQGEAAIVLKQLRLKFEALDSTTRSRVRGAEPSQLERWAQRLLTAGSLEEVFS